MKRRKKNKPVPKPRSRVKIITVVILVFATVTATALIGQVRSNKKKAQSTKKESDTVEFAPASFAQNSPSKEYIYAGGKLVATEEPSTAVSANDAQFISMSYREPCANLGPGNNWQSIGTGSFGLTSPQTTTCPQGVTCQEYLVRVTMKNAGTNAWSTGQGYSLGSQNPANNTIWKVNSRPANRVPLSFIKGTTGAPIVQGQEVTFEFSVSKPDTFPPEGFNFQWQMVKDGASGSEFFGQKTPNVVIPASAWLCSTAEGNLATFVSQSVPTSMVAGQTYNVSVTMNNSGTTIWTPEGNYKLGAQVLENNTVWGLNRVAVPAPVPPGSDVTFTFTITAPANPCAYNFQWMMIQEGVDWFGYLTPGVSVSVTPSCPANITTSAALDQCGKIVTYNASGPGNCDGSGGLTCSPASGSFFPVGTTTVTCTSTSNGNCTFTITVTDTQAPTITCPVLVTAVAPATCAPASSAAVTFSLPAASDNCSAPSVVCSPPSGSSFPVGTTTVTCTATDASSNTAQCSFPITVFNGCLQSDSDPGDVVLFNTYTGEYRFCCNGVLLRAGTGSVTSQGCSYTISHNTTDRRVLIRPNFSSKSGTASLQAPVGTTACTISDSNMANNTCQCSAP